MKTKSIKLGFVLILFLSGNIAFSQVGIGTTTPNTSAILDVDVTSLAANGKKGFLPPRMTTTERNDIASPATGLLIYNTDTNILNYYTGSGWTVIASTGSFVDLSTEQTVAGNKTFTGTLTAEGRLMIPMGEISYYSSSELGLLIDITGQSTGTALGTDNMIKIDTGSGTEFVNDNFGLGANSTLTYQGAVGRYFHIALSFSYRPVNDKDVFIFGVARTTDRNNDGSRTTEVEDQSKLVITTGVQADYNSSAMHVLLWLDSDDSIDFYVGNMKTSGGDIYIKSFNFVAIGM
ncbi:MULTISPECIES: hypothetical protein [Flavobacteriaceae]|uniref:Uncharacterized protein n=2 Tax=Flavobacteriaceae TaxID=49546 RepID=A0A4Y8ASS4_9FLAO|nr:MULTISPECIES: hypothetical protein [Flavobacteriaceae]TEW74929.1 hypothetical protein E2488_05225 [Gramella jeungdoensis]GGK42972.1 hypothetical protein GCM10007963_08780 [Lutibacter litoralis]